MTIKLDAGTQGTEDVREVLSVSDEAERRRRKKAKGRGADGDQTAAEVIQENLNEVISFDLPLTDVTPLNE